MTLITATLGISTVTFVATILHLRSQKQIKSIAIREMWKIRAYQEIPRQWE